MKKPSLFTKLTVLCMCMTLALMLVGNVIE